MSALDDTGHVRPQRAVQHRLLLGRLLELPEGPGQLRRISAGQDRAAISQFGAARDGLVRCSAGTPSAEGKKYLDFLANRISCTLLHLRAFQKMAALQPLFAGKIPSR